MNKRGFSIVELVVVITIIGILLALGAVSFRGYQENARNEERRVRAENIARYLETLYKTGSNNPSIKQGTYPPTSLISTPNPDSTTVSTGSLEQLFSKNGFNLINLKSAGKDDYGLAIASTNSEPTTVSVDEYVYQPIYYYPSGDTDRCYDPSWDCRSFNIYYATNDGGSVTTHRITSAH